MLLALGAGLWMMFGATATAQEPGARLVRGDGYQVLEGLDLVSISHGLGSHSCGLRADGRVVCWGPNQYGQAEAPSGRFSQVSAGVGHTCGVRTDGSVACWGRGAWGERPETPGGRFRHVSAGWRHSCGVRLNGAVVCWGGNAEGETAAPSGRYTQVSTGHGHSCALGIAGNVVCWGNDYGDLSDVASGPFSEISGACGFKKDRQVVCWGSEDFGQTNPPADRFRQISAVHDFACGVRADGTVVCWGYSAQAVTLVPPGRFSQISVGYGGACGLLVDGRAQCWWARAWCGFNDSGEVSCRADDFKITEAPSGRFSQVSAGTAHSCGLRSDGMAICWGYNGDGQTEAPSGRFNQVSAGVDHSCGLRADGEVICWGYRLLGETEYYNQAERFTQISSGSGSCATRVDGALFCWIRGQEPRQIGAPFSRFIQASAGLVGGGRISVCGVEANGSGGCWSADGEQLWSAEGHFREIVPSGQWRICGLRSNETVACWGYSLVSHVEGPVGRFSQISGAIGFGAFGWCGVQVDGAAVCWGQNGRGQAEAPSGRFTQVSRGQIHSCGLRTDGRVICWGLNLFANLHVAGNRIFTTEAAHTSETVNGRIVARRLADGRTEFGFRPEGGESVLPRSRFFPANARVGRWLQSSPVSVDGQEIGRINARLLADGRIEFALMPADSERILPRSRYFPATARVERWLRSSVLELGGGSTSADQHGIACEVKNLGRLAPESMRIEEPWTNNPCYEQAQEQVYRIELPELQRLDIEADLSVDLLILRDANGQELRRDEPYGERGISVPARINMLLKPGTYNIVVRPSRFKLDQGSVVTVHEDLDVGDEHIRSKIGEMYAPVLRFHRDWPLVEHYLPVGVEAMTDHARLMFNDKPWPLGDSVIDDSLSSPEDLPIGGDERIYLDLKQDPGGESLGHDRWWNRVKGDYENVVYVRVASGDEFDDTFEDFVVVQYWPSMCSTMEATIMRATGKAFSSYSTGP